MTRQIIIFGATGYTGRHTAQALVEKGIRPILAGRNKTKLKELAGQLGGLDITTADVADPQSVEAIVNRDDILISTVGPFTVYGDAAVRAATVKGAHYIDSTGEPGFIDHVFTTYGPRAKEQGIALITACGYDYVPGNCAAAMALDAAGPEAVRVDTGYYIIGKNALDMSQGTLASVCYSSLEPGKTFRGGRLVTCYGGEKVRTFSTNGQKRPGILLPTTECFSLPNVYPRLQEVNVYLGWFGNLSYLLNALSKVNIVMLKLPFYLSLSKKLIALATASKGIGPDETLRSQTGSHIVAEAFDTKGTLLARTDLKGANGYDFTFRILAWAAEQIMNDDWEQAKGAVGPVEAFGLDRLKEGVAGAGLSPQE